VKQKDESDDRKNDDTEVNFAKTIREMLITFAESLSTASNKEFCHKPRTSISNSNNTTTEQIEWIMEKLSGAKEQNQNKSEDGKSWNNQTTKVENETKIDIQAEKLMDDGSIKKKKKKKLERKLESQ
jgi:hypothetical protein